MMNHVVSTGLRAIHLEMPSGMSRCISQQLKGAQALLEEGLCVSGARGAWPKPKEQSEVVEHELGLVFPQLEEAALNLLFYWAFHLWADLLPF